MQLGFIALRDLVNEIRTEVIKHNGHIYTVETKCYTWYMKTFAFIDASNLFYGGEKSLGWKIDYKKLLQYLKEKYTASNVYYFGGVEIHQFPYNYQTEETVSIKPLETYLLELLKNKGDKLDEATILLIGRHLKRVRFYKKLEEFYESTKNIDRATESLQKGKEKQLLMPLISII